MARINGLIGTNLTGSAGKLTFTMVNGQNIMKQKATVVKNPRTVAQQSQRMKFNSVTNTYARTQSITNHSFFGIPYGAKSMNYFKSKASQVIANSNSFAARGTNIIPFELENIMVSKGNLSQHKLIWDLYIDSVTNNSHMYAASKVTIATTVAQFISIFGINKGQQFTYLGIGCGAVGGYSSLITIGPNKVQPLRQKTVTSSFVIKTSATDATPAFVITEDEGIFTLNPAILDTENSQDADKLRFDTTATHMACTQIFHDDLLNAVDYEAAILSEKINGIWDRSNESLHPVYNTALHVIIGTQALAFDAASVTGTYNPASPYYLNNAEV